MLKAMLFPTMLSVILLLQQTPPAGDKPAAPPKVERPPASQPASQPARPASTLKKPVQAEILEALLQKQEAPKPILPEKPDIRRGAEEKVGGPLPPGLFLEGTILVERPGRLIRTGDRALFEFRAEGEIAAVQTMPILENQMLEALEREAETGAEDFIITAEVTLYRGHNYLILRKILRRVGHGNLSP